MKKMLCLLLFAYTATIAQTNGLYINEFMASNSQTYADVAGEYEDWIEIYNDNNTPMDLAGYYITDDLSRPTKYKLTTTVGQLVVAPKSFFIIWGGGNISLGPDHIDIGLSANGESLALVAPDGTTVLDSYTFSAQKADVSMGRTINGGGEWKYFQPATPKASNHTSTPFSGFLPPPTFSQVGGLYSNPFDLTLATTEAGASILYTLDGSTPEKTALSGVPFRYKNTYPQDPGDPVGDFLYDTQRTQIYNSAISIKDRSNDTNRFSMKSSTYHRTPNYTPRVLINKAHTVRARTFKDGYLPSDVVTNTYFPAEGSKSKYTLPVISLSVPEKHLFNWDSGIYNAGQYFELWRAFLPTTPADGSAYANFQTTWEHPLSMEYFAAGTGQRLFQRNAGFRIHGSFSAALPRKSLRMYFRSEYGESNLGFPIFPGRSDDNYKRLILRNSGNESNSILRATYLRDMSLHKLVRHLNLDVQDAQPSILYINGEYWGLHNIRERQDRHYFEAKYGIKEGELDLLENNAEVEEGDSLTYDKMYKYIGSQNPANAVVYDSILKLMDIENFIDYQIAEIFVGNTDWPHNNVRFYRKRTNFDPTAPKGQDGRWRWAFYDADFGFAYQPADPVTKDNLARATNTGGANTWATLLLRRLFLNPTFKQQFITRFADLLNSTFLPANTAKVINYYREQIAPEIPEHIARWRNSGSLVNWTNAVNDLVTYGNQRPAEQRKHISTKFSITAQHDLTVNLNDDNQGVIKINTIIIDSTTAGINEHPYPWTGIYFDNIPVQLIAIPKTGYRFVAWEGDTTSTKDTLVINIKKSTSVKAIFEKDQTAEIDQIVHYWHFNNLPSGNLDNLPADSSVIGGTLISYSGTGAGYMDRTNATDGSEINAQYGQPLGQALRVRNPSDTRTLVFTTPSTGFKNLKISYAAQRTNNGAQLQRVSYSINNGGDWILIKDDVSIEEAFELKSFDLTDSAGTSDNASLLFKIEFLGSNAPSSSGNNRFDNFLITGVPSSTGCQTGDWTGAVDNDWFNPNNWCGGIPGTTDSVTIKEGLPYYPQIPASPAITIKSLNLKVGGSLGLMPNAQLTISGGQCILRGDVQIGINAKLNINN
jgi:hypothetical protein